MEFIYDFFSTCKGKICVVLWRDLQHFDPGENGYKGIQIEYFPKNFWVIKGLIWRKISVKNPQIWLKVVTLVSEKKIKKVWNGVGGGIGKKFLEQRVYYFLNTVFSCKFFPLRVNIYSLIRIGLKIPGAESLLLYNAVISW